MKRYLYYCRDCKLRFQNQNFGYGYPVLDGEGSALCPYCSSPMEQSLGDVFPADWVEESPRIDPEDAPSA